MTTMAMRTTFAAIEERIQRRDYEAALDLIRQMRLDEGQHSARDRLMLDVSEGECLAFLGEYNEAISLSRHAARLLRRGEDHVLYARACFSLSVAQHYLGDLDQATENINLARFSFQRADDHAGVVRSLNWLGNIMLDKGDYEHALASYRQCIEIAREHHMDRWVAIAGDNRARILLLMGQLREARSAFRGNRKECADNGEHLNVLRHDLSMAYLEILERRFGRAEALLRRVERDSPETSPVRESGIWYEYMGDLELSRGRFDEAAEYLGHAIRIGQASGPDESLIGQSRRLLAEVLLARGDLETASAECERALESIRTVGERIEEGAVHRILGAIHAGRYQPEDASREFRLSADILMQIGARLEWAKTCLTAGRCTILSERERLAYLFEAERLFAEIGVAYWIEQARAALKDVLQDRCGPSVCETSESESEPEAPIIVTKHAGTLSTLRMAECWAQEDLAILITGETGTGKDLLASYVRWMSPRRHRPFVPIDLNTVPDSLWESELFGHRKGTFTGAAGEKTGLLESANGGTVFLNEIGNLPLNLQAKLLEFLDTRQVRRIGDARPKTLDVRFIAATNTDLRHAVDDGKFRADLYYRLEQAPLHLLPLRQRREDIPLLLQHFLSAFGVGATLAGSLLAQRWVKRVSDLPWKGNVRELRNFTQRLVALAGRRSGAREFAAWAERLIEHMRKNGNGNGNGNGSVAADRERLLDTLARNAWNQRAVARDLGMSEGGVRHMMRRLKIRRPA